MHRLACQPSGYRTNHRGDEQSGGPINETAAPGLVW